jgi:hypothetical protein
LRQKRRDLDKVFKERKALESQVNVQLDLKAKLQTGSASLHLIGGLFQQLTVNDNLSERSRGQQKNYPAALDVDFMNVEQSYN